jgi:hypothetical protein
MRFNATLPDISNSLILGWKMMNSSKVEMSIRLSHIVHTLSRLTISYSAFSPLGPSKCSSRSQWTVSLLASKYGIFLDARKKSLYSFIDFDRSKKCSKVSCGLLASCSGNKLLRASAGLLLLIDRAVVVVTLRLPWVIIQGSSFIARIIMTIAKKGARLTKTRYYKSLDLRGRASNTNRISRGSILTLQYDAYYSIGKAPSQFRVRMVMPVDLPLFDLQTIYSCEEMREEDLL